MAVCRRRHLISELHPCSQQSACSSEPPASAWAWAAGCILGPSSRLLDINHLPERCVGKHLTRVLNVDKDSSAKGHQDELVINQLCSLNHCLEAMNACWNPLQIRIYFSRKALVDSPLRRCSLGRGEGALNVCGCSTHIPEMGWAQAAAGKYSKPWPLP